MDEPHKQEFHVRDLATRSVTLFPTRAQVVREIKDVVLKPGANEINVIGVTPTADENSIKVEGTGLATITDITVELLPNRDIFEDIYPDSDSEPDKDESEEEEEEDDSEDSVNAALEEVKDKLVALQDEQKRAKEIIATAENRLQILNAYCYSVRSRTTVDVDIAATLETYHKERQIAFRDHMEGVALDRDLGKRISKLEREKARLERIQARERKKAAEEKAKAKREKEKKKAQQRRRDEERKKEKDRIRRERQKFWPRLCYTVRISLDAGVNFTPSSSRRGSIASATDVELVSGKSPKEDQASVTCDLTLSYVTSSAFWSPSYDLALSTTTNKATLSFDASLTNMTSETWTNSKVILSTSQASFSGLADDVPLLVPWRLKLANKGFGPGSGADIVHSREELDQKRSWNSRKNAPISQKPRKDLFGVDPQPKIKQAQRSLLAPAADPSYNAFKTRAAGFGMPANGPGAPALDSNNAGANTGSSLFGQVGANGGGGGSLFGQAEANPRNNPTGGIFGLRPADVSAAGPRPLEEVAVSRARNRSRERAASSAPIEPEAYFEEEFDNAGDDDVTLPEPNPELSFEDPSIEESGLTSTYDLPQAKTLKPSAAPSKQRIARITFSDVSFSRTVVAKYRPAAYLRARLRNTSKLTLHQGPMGLTLDGSFLGRSTMPRCSAGDTFTVGLGVDPAIKVIYPKPEVTRSTRGVFARGECNVYTRSVTLVNTRAASGRPVDIAVFDQIPVSEDEKIRVEMLQLAASESGKTDNSSSSSSSSEAASVSSRKGAEDRSWGSAKTSQKKEGEVQWNVSLNAGKSVKLVLQYEVSYPVGERVTEVY